MGEHAVVYGKPALLSAISKRVYVIVESSDSGTNIISDDNRFIISILGIVKKHFHLNSLPPLKIEVASNIKNGYHLGSSAAVASAALSALIFYLKKIWNPETFNQLVFEAEKLKHGNPSGADNSAVIYGGFVWYRKELDFLKSIWQVNIKFGKNMDNFYLIDSGKAKESTKEMVAKVAENYLVRKKEMDLIFAENELQTKNITKAVKTNDKNLLLASIIKGQRTLEKIGVVPDSLLEFIKEIEKNGGAVKILGGGGMQKGAGYLLCFHENRKGLKKISDKYNFPVEQITLGEEGLKLESGKIK